ncbi:MAG: PQQ-binding-like beta-propeller repeat protein, partial [Flavisolibacter sp.]|nr:PQQ-binding-like beta-propeller repeat protein [Flavisolibacter sp.]
MSYYIIPGNHDTGWSESGGLAFSKTFDNDKFHFVAHGIHFIGCASRPYVRMSDGHVPRHHINWLQAELKKMQPNEPIVFLNHYPLEPALDNWYEVISLLKQKNTVLALCGHGHANRTVQAENIPAVMGRSNLRAKEAEGRYNIVQITKDTFYLTERHPLSGKEMVWIKVTFQKHDYKETKSFPRPDFPINQLYPQVQPLWTFQSDANVISTPAVAGNYVVFGNQNGMVQALHQKNGKIAWQFKTDGPIFSSPAVAGDK